MKLSEIPNEKLSVIVMAATSVVLQNGGYITISVVGDLAEVYISKVPIEVSGDTELKDTVQLG